MNEIKIPYSFSAEQIKLIIDCLDEASHKIRKKSYFAPAGKDRLIIDQIDNLIDYLEQENIYGD